MQFLLFQICPTLFFFFFTCFFKKLWRESHSAMGDAHTHALQTPPKVALTLFLHQGHEENSFELPRSTKLHLPLSVW